VARRGRAGQRWARSVDGRVGGFRQASWDEALDTVAGGIRRARDEFGGESILPYSYMGTMGLLQGGSMGHRLMNALGPILIAGVIVTAALVRAAPA